MDSQGEKFTHRAINAHGNITTLDESHDLPHLDQASRPMSGRPADKGTEIKEEIQRQWQWSVAEEILPGSKEERTSEILSEVGRMEVYSDSVGDKVKAVKKSLDSMEEEGGVVLHLKDS